MTRKKGSEKARSAVTVRRDVQALVNYPLNEEEVLTLADSAPSPDEQLETADRSARMAAALARLPERQREAIVLQYYQELSNIDAAALMNISVEALESLLSRARRQLRSQLADTPGLARPGRGKS